MTERHLQLQARFHTLMPMWWRCVEKKLIKERQRTAIEEEFDRIAEAIGTTFFRTAPPTDEPSVFLPLVGRTVSRPAILRSSEYLGSIDATFRKRLTEQKIDPAKYAEEFFRDLSRFEYASVPHRTKPVTLITDQDVVQVLKPLASEDDFRPAMQHVLFDAEAQHAVATDGFALVALPRAVPGETYGMHPKTGAAMTDQYPNWRSVVPLTATVQSEPIALERLLVRLQGLLNLSRISTWDAAMHGDVWGRLGIGPKFDIVFAAGVLSRAVVALFKAGVRQVVLRASHPHRPLLIVDVADERRFALAMPVRDDGARPVGELLRVRTVPYIRDFTGIVPPKPTTWKRP